MSVRAVVRSPWLALVGLTGLAVWPVARAGYPAIGDGLNHLYRLVEFDHLLHGGVWFPRWATDLCYGYGCPVFNFYPPLVYYLGALFHTLGLSFAHSLLAIYLLAFGLAVSGAYALTHERWGAAGGLIAAGAYSLAPYLYYDALARGALPETWGLGLLPWGLWAYARLARQPNARTFLAATLMYTSLILSHLLSALLAAPIFMGLAFISGLDRQIPAAESKPRTSAFCLLPASICLALALAAYFLLPALLETSAVQFDRLTTPGDLDFHNHFLTVSALFALPRAYDPRLVFVGVPPSLSLTALALAAFALAYHLYRALRRQTLNFGFASSGSRLWDWGVGMGFLLLCLLTLPLTIRLWEALPLANLVQFPWRLVGPASLLLALLAASAAPAFEYLKFGDWDLAPGVLLSAFFFVSLTWTFSPAFSIPAAPTVGDLATYEFATGQLGMTSAGEFLPTGVRQLPPPDSLAAPYAARVVIDRLGALPEDVALIAQSATLTSAAATVEAQAPAHLTFNFFYFPGWRATVDGQPAPLHVSDPHGLIIVAIPSGQHTVSIAFGPTPLRAIASAISLAALAALVAATLRFGVWPLGIGSSLSRPLAPAPHLFAAVAAVVLLVLRIALIDGKATPFSHTRFDGATVAGVNQPLDVNFEDQLVLLGLDLPRATLAADATLPLTLYWRAQNPPEADYSTTMQVVDALGHLFGQSDAQHPGRVPTSRWRLDQYARDDHLLRLLPGTPPGDYQLIVGVYQFGGRGLSVLDEDRAPRGQAYTLGTLTLTRATRPPDRIDAAQPLNRPLGPLTLMGATFNTTAPLAGDELRLTLFWRAQQSLTPPLHLLLELSAPDGRVIASRTTPPARADYPTSAWASGEVVRAPLRFRIPAAASAGPAELRASLFAGDGSRVSGPVVIAALDLRVPARLFTLPAVSHPRADEFGGVIRLLGYDLTPNGITLYWRALALTDVSYTVFVHALSADGHLLAQVDALPLGGVRPTTGWLPGEVLTDPYTLPLSGAAKIEIGLYNTQNAERLGTVIITP